MENKSTNGECRHKPLIVDCDRFSLLFYSLQAFRKEVVRWPEEVEHIDAMLVELENGAYYE